MNSDGRVVASGAKSRQIAYNASGEHAVEGGFVFGHDGRFYLLFSAGKCCGYNQSKPLPGDEYSIRVCRADRPDGPFVDRAGRACTQGGGSLLLGSHDRVYGPGGQGVLEDPVHGTVLYYHYGEVNVPLRLPWW
jgi:arabinan endo-1,5-alpha-L-arabinosidase